LFSNFWQLCHLLGNFPDGLVGKVNLLCDVILDYRLSLRTSKKKGQIGQDLAPGEIGNFR